MQAINPVDVHVENEWHEESDNVQKPNRKGHQTSQMRTRVFNKVKTKKPKASLSPPSSRIPKQVVIPTLVLPVRSRSSSPNRGPWVPPPGRSTRGQKLSWQSPKSRLEINPVTEITLDDEESLSTAREKQNTTNNSQTNTLSTVENEKLVGEIQIYEKRIQGLIDGIGMLKDRIHNHANQEQTDQLRSDIDSSLLELEQLQENYTQRIASQPSRTSRSPSPTRDNSNPRRSTSADEQRQRRTTTPKVSFQDQPVIERRRARSTTPVRGPIYLNADREQLLISLADSEADIAQITKQLSSVKDVLTKLKFDDQAVSLEVEQLYQHRNELLHLIEQFERSNKQLKEYLRHQYHLEAEHGIVYDQYDTLKTSIHALQHENDDIRRLLLDRENDNIALQTELERTRTHAIGFDTMKTSLENNRAHLQRELYAKEGEIGRLQCALRSLEGDLQRSRFHSDHIRRPGKRPSTLSHATTKSKSVIIERLPSGSTGHDHQSNELKTKSSRNPNEQTDEIQSEISHLRTKLEQAERLANEYQAQLHTQTLKNSASNSKNHLSELELDKIRARLQKRIEELSPLPELLKHAETENERLQKQNNELKKRISDQSTFPTQTSRIDTHLSPGDDHQRTLQRRITTLEEQNEKLLKALNVKEEELRTVQSRPSTSVNPQIDFTKTNFKIREDSFGSKDHLLQKNAFDVEQQIARLRLEHDQLKREKDQLEQRFTSQFNELREKLEQSHNRNQGMQNYINSLKTTYATLFNETLPTSSTRYTTT